MRSSRPGMKSASMPRRRSVSSRTKRTYSSMSSRADSTHSGWFQTLERLGEAVHVLSHAELLDPALGGSLAVALRRWRR